MREASTGLLVELDPESNVTDLLLEQHAKDPVHALYSRKGPGGWTDVSVQQFLEQVTALAKGLIAGGLTPGDTVAVMSATRYEWTVVDFAIWFAGGVTVPIYETSSASQVEWILHDSGARRVFVEDHAKAALVQGVLDASTVLGDRIIAVVRMEHDGAAPNLASLAAAGSGVTDAELERHRTRRVPRGRCVPRLHLGHHRQAQGLRDHARQLRPRRQEHRALPARDPHAAALPDVDVPSPGPRPGPGGAGHLPELRHNPRPHRQAPRSSWRTWRASSPPSCWWSPGSSKRSTPERPTRLPPPARNAPSRPRRPPRSTTPRPLTPPPGATATGPGLLLRARHGLFDRLFYPKLRQAFGGQLRYTVSGASPLSSNDAHFFRGAGIPVLEGYGLTETTAPCTANTPARTKVGTVGIPVPGTTIRVADDGEILVKGIGVFKGYHANEAANAEAFVDGFFRTGDLGSLDEDGFLTITGRKKDLLVTAGGKNVAPGPLEEKIREHQLVGQAVVVGDGRPFVSALINLDAEGTPRTGAPPGSCPT